jgi:hypothetical protein
MNIMASNFLLIEAIALNRLCFISFCLSSSRRTLLLLRPVFRCQVMISLRHPKHVSISSNHECIERIRLQRRTDYLLTNLEANS